MGSRPRPINLPSFNYHAKELGFFIRALIEPVQRLPVFIPEFSRKLDDGVCVVSGGIGEQFAQVIMIRYFQLVLDDYRPVAAQIVRQHVQ